MLMMMMSVCMVQSIKTVSLTLTLAQTVTPPNGKWRRLAAGLCLPFLLLLIAAEQCWKFVFALFHSLTACFLLLKESLFSSFSSTLFNLQVCPVFVLFVSCPVAANYRH